MTNKEMAQMIRDFFSCNGECANCSCDLILCSFPNKSYEQRKQFALEVANRLDEVEEIFKKFKEE